MSRVRVTCVFFSESLQMNCGGRTLWVNGVPPHLERHTIMHSKYTHLTAAFYLCHLPKCIHHCSSRRHYGKTLTRILVTWHMHFRIYRWGGWLNRQRFSYVFCLELHGPNFCRLGVSTVTGCGLHGPSSIPRSARFFSPPQHSEQLWIHSASYEISLTRGKAVGAWISPLSSI
jgi:hypothetical protein